MYSQPETLFTYLLVSFIVNFEMNFQGWEQSLEHFSAKLVEFDCKATQNKLQSQGVI